VTNRLDGEHAAWIDDEVSAAGGDGRGIDPEDVPRPTVRDKELLELGYRIRELRGGMLGIDGVSHDA
jgi:hypothetical protein